MDFMGDIKGYTPVVKHGNGKSLVYRKTFLSKLPCSGDFSVLIT